MIVVIFLILKAGEKAQKKTGEWAIAPTLTPNSYTEDKSQDQA